VISRKIIWLVVPLLMTVLLFSSLPVAEAQTGNIGVKVGYWANYHGTGILPEPEWYILDVTDVSGNTVTINVDMYYEDGGKESLILSGDPIAGTGYLSDALAPGGLGPGDQFTIWLEEEMGYTGPVTIIETTFRTYAGESREVNHVIIYGCDIYYDKETGFFVEGDYGGYYLVVMTETNMWGPASAIIPEHQGVTETNPAIIDATETADTLLRITSISDSCIVAIEAAVEAPSPPGELMVVGTPVKVNSSKPVSVTAELRMYYDSGELSSSGVIEGSLTIHHWDGGAWVPVESNVNTEAKYVWADIDHFSIWALFGESAAAEEGVPIVWIVVPVICVIAVFGAILLIRRR